MVPSDIWEKLNGKELKERLKNWDWLSEIQGKFEKRHYRTLTEAGEDGVHADMAPAGDLRPFTLDQLMDEIESGGWKVQISRKTDEE